MDEEDHDDLVEVAHAVATKPLQPGGPGLHQPERFPGGCNDRDPESTGQDVHQVIIDKTDPQEIMNILFVVSVGLAVAENRPGEELVGVEDAPGQEEGRAVVGGRYGYVPLEVIEHHQLNGVEVTHGEVVLDKTVKLHTLRDVPVLLHLGCQEQSSQSHQVQLWILTI